MEGQGEDKIYLLDRRAILHPPNMDIVTPTLDTEGNLMGWKSVITGLSDTTWEDDKLMELPETGWKSRSELFPKTLWTSKIG